jgi:predicted flap endonuclease-1-like 5' DNA nuclease
MALLLWWWLRRRPEEEIILRTKLGTISRVRGIGKPGPVLSPAEGPVPSKVEGTPADDLTRIAGIGPKISNLLRGAGIATYAQLAATDVAQLKQILAQSGIRVADPGTWPEQARLAAAGDWDALKRLQGQLKGGRRV